VKQKRSNSPGKRQKAVILQFKSFERILSCRNAALMPLKQSLGWNRNTEFKGEITGKSQEYALDVR
jgi:hypothetical protein